MRLHRVEHRMIDQRWHLDGDNLAGRFQRLVLGALVELVPADICRPGQDAMDLADPPASAVARESDNKLNILILTARTLDIIVRQAACLVFGETASPRNTSTA